MYINLLVMTKWNVLVKQPPEVSLCSLERQLYQVVVLLYVLKNFITKKQLAMDKCDLFTQTKHVWEC